MNDNGVGITSLEWHPKGRDSDTLAFADREGYVGVFEGVWPSPSVGGVRGGSGIVADDDPLVDDSLLMEVGWNGYAKGLRVT